MTDLELLVRDALAKQVPLRLDRRPTWDDVLAHVGAQMEQEPRWLPSHRRRPRRHLLALAVVAVVIVAGSAFAALGHDPFGALSSWLRGNPGKPAAPAEQAGFAARNDASYAAFSKATKLRLLGREKVGGKTFSLLGFRNGASLCLRLVRADLPAGRGANQCVTLRELRHSTAPALVASEAQFGFGRPGTSVDGIFGFADDTVRDVEIQRALGGRQIVPVANNVFVGLRAQPSGTVKHHPPYDPIVRVRAFIRNGRQVAVPFIAGEFGEYTNGLPRVPSYLRTQVPRPGQLPGPAQATVHFLGGTIGWIEGRQPRGEPFTPDPRLMSELGGAVIFARSVQPDPASPFRLGLALIKLGRHSRMAPAKPGELSLCFSDLEPLGHGPTGAACTLPTPSGSLFRSGQPLEMGGISPEQITRLSGVAADPVAEIDLYLASGRVIPAALLDNAYTVEAPAVQFPAKLVAYNKSRRPIWVEVLAGPAKPVPCPATTFTRPVSALPAPKPYERIDLATGNVNGQPIFGHGVSDVEAALGQPDRIQTTSTTNGHREPTLYYGGTRSWNAALTVIFGWRQHQLRAITLSYQSPSLTDTKLGHLLRLQPLALQHRITSTYRSDYQLSVSYGSQPGAPGCGAIFQTPNRAVQLFFGLNPSRPSRPYLVLSHGY